MSSHENKTFRSRSVVKQKGMVFGFRKTATAVTRPERQIDRSGALNYVSDDDDVGNKYLVNQSISESLNASSGQMLLQQKLYLAPDRN